MRAMSAPPPKVIVTHPGSAHKDDVLAVALLIAEHGVPVERREPTAAEIADPSVAVVDIGGEHEPARLSFDHHQLPRDHPPTCSLSLVLEHLGLYDDAARFFDWVEPAEWLDSRGADRTADWLGVPRRVIGQLNSPVDVTLLRRFSRATGLVPGDTIYEFLRCVGDDMLDYLRDIRERLEIVRHRVKRWSLSHGDDVVRVVFLPRVEPPVTEGSQAVASYVRAEGIEQTTAVIVYPDSRGSGYGLRRYDDDLPIDFTRLEGEPDVPFVHKTGFLCKSTATDEGRLQELILAAWGR